jgi:hypothetical protein
MQKVYPRIAYVPKIISENGGQALAVIIPGSELRPHFAGLSYVRKGSESIEASDQQFAALIAQRNSMAARILSWKDEKVTVMMDIPVIRPPLENTVTNRQFEAVVVDCDQFYVTLRQSDGVQRSFPLSRVEINFDNTHKRLLLEILR